MSETCWCGAPVVAGSLRCQACIDQGITVVNGEMTAHAAFQRLMAENADLTRQVDELRQTVERMKGEKP